MNTFYRLFIVACVAALAHVAEAQITNPDGLVTKGMKNIPAGSTANATLTIDGTDGNTPGLAFTNFGGAKVGLRLPTNTSLCFNAGGTTCLIENTAGNLQLSGTTLDTNGLTLTNSSATNGGMVSVMATKAIRFLTTTGADTIEGSNPSGTTEFLLNSLNTHAAGDALFQVNNNGVPAITVSANGNTLLKGGAALDANGGVFNIGTGNSGNVTVGKVGQSETLQGSWAFYPVATIGSFYGAYQGIVLTGKDFGFFYAKKGNVTNLAFREVVCNIQTTTGVGAGGTLIIANVTDSSTLCTPASGNFNCAAAASTPFDVGDCNSAIASAKIYTYQLSGCGTFPTGLECSTEIVK